MGRCVEYSRTASGSILVVPTGRFVVVVVVRYWLRVSDQPDVEGLVQAAGLLCV